MSSIIQSLISMITGDTLGKISEQTGISKEKAQEVLPDVLAVLTGALARNSSESQGAQALSDALAKDHDGSILNNLSNYISNYQSGDGSGILDHVLGNKMTTIEQGLSQKTGLDTGSIGNLLIMTAPIIMGMLGKTQKNKSLNENSLSNLLGKEQRQAQSIAPEAIDILNQKIGNRYSTKRQAKDPLQVQAQQQKKFEKKEEKNVKILDLNNVKIPQDIFDVAEQRLLSNPGKYKNSNFRCQFDIEGSNGGKWYILVNNDKRVVAKGVLENATGTVKMKESDFIQLILGKLNAPMALLSGKIKVTGDINHIIKLVESLMA